MVEKTATHPELQTLLALSAARHSHLCPRQVLGVRIGLAGLAALGFTQPPTDKRLLVIVETDGCFEDGVEVSTQTSPGRRTLRIEDLGKVAATFIDIITGQSVRISPHPLSRQRAEQWAPPGQSVYEAMLNSYQVIPDDLLLVQQIVHLNASIESIVSEPGLRTHCQLCGEEIINAREVLCQGQTLCRTCAGPAYYQKAE